MTFITIPFMSDLCRVRRAEPTDLQAKQVVHGADDDVNRGGAACLSAQVVLKI